MCTLGQFSFVPLSFSDSRENLLQLRLQLFASVLGFQFGLLQHLHFTAQLLIITLQSLLTLLQVQLKLHRHTHTQNVVVLVQVFYAE